MGCILGVGVPVGFAVVLAAHVGTEMAFRALVASPVSDQMKNYATWVYSRCRAFIANR